MKNILYYVHDPMCSWCWGFKPVWEDIYHRLPKNIEVQYLLGGLAPDSDKPMPEAMQHDIAGYWRKIQKHIPGTIFNYDFWDNCKPRRSTYPACRAVIATRKQHTKLERNMIEAIQNAYYVKAQNPSDNETLVALAVSLGLDKNQFIHDIDSAKTQKQLEKEIHFARNIGAQGFPSMILKDDTQYYSILLDYNDPAVALLFIAEHLK